MSLKSIKKMGVNIAIILLLIPPYLLSKLLPYRTQLNLGKYLGRLLWLFKNNKLYKTTLKNLELCYPTLSLEARATLLKKNYESVGMSVLETTMSFWIPNKKIKGLLTVHGMAYANEALEKKCGIIVVSPHFACLDLAGRLLAQQIPLTVMYRPHKIAVINRLILHYRAKYYKGMIPREDIRRMLRALKQNQIIWYAADGDHGAKNSVFVPFFGVTAATLTATSRLSKLSQATVLPCEFYRRPHGLGYDFYFLPPLKNFPSDNLEQDTLHVNQSLEASIRKHPDQYIWQYKRFKTRPAGEKRLY